MEKIQGHTVAYLKDYYSADLEDWQEHWESDEYEQDILAGFSHACAVGVLNLARLTGGTSILPTAFLHCSTLEERVFYGFDLADGTHEELAREDLKRLLKAKCGIAALSLSIYVEAYQPSVFGACTTADTCRTAFKTGLVLLYGYSGIVTNLDPFRPLLRMYEIGAVSLCSHCTPLAMGRWKAAQTTFWKQMPETFDIAVDGWC